MEDKMNHSVQSVVVNLIHVWQCRFCGKRWTANVDYRIIEKGYCMKRKQ